MNILTRVLIIIFLLGLLVNPASSSPIDAYGGFVSNDRVNEGEEVRFGGTFHNFFDNTVYVYSLNISFVERLGVGASRDPERPNMSRVYDSDRRSVVSNASLTDVLIERIDFGPGSYNVSIFFSYSNTSNISPTSVLGEVYALTNATFVIEGLTRTVEVFRFIGYVILGIIILGVASMIYNRIRRP